MTNEQFRALDNFKKMRNEYGYQKTTEKAKKMDIAKSIWDRIKPKIEK